MRARAAARPWPIVRDLSVEPVRRIEALREHATIYPDQKRVFAAFAVPLDQVRVVIVGLDPYPTPGHATGLAFSVGAGEKPLPPGLRSIHQAMRNDGFDPPEHGDLSGWVDEGVLLLNRALTFEDDQKAGAHLRIWRDFTDAVIRELSERPGPVVFVLWGRQAQKVRGLVDENDNIVLTAPHPSSRGSHRVAFQEAGTFKDVNSCLESIGTTPIDWSGALRERG